MSTLHGLMITPYQQLELKYDDLETQSLQKLLLDKGVVVVTQVLTPEECRQINTGYLDDAKALLSNTSADLAATNPKGQNGSSLWKNLGAPLSKNAQLRRTNPKVKKIWEVLYETESLVQSMDSYTFRLAGWSLPKVPQKNYLPNLAKEIKKKLMGSSLKPHQDATLDGAGGGIYEGSLTYQLMEKNMFPHCVQGCMVTVDQLAYQEDDVTKTPPGFVACLGKPERLNYAKGDWYVLNDKDLKDYKVLERITYIEVPKGSVVLWRSDVIHANSLGYPSKAPPSTITRAGQFICWGPKEFRQESEKAKKIKYGLIGHSNNHWPTIYTNGGSGGHYSDRYKDWQPLSSIQLTNNQVAYL